MAAQTVMVRRVVVIPGFVVAGGVEAVCSRCTHFAVATLPTLAPRKRKKLHNALWSTLYYTNTLEYRNLDG